VIRGLGLAALTLAVLGPTSRPQQSRWTIDPIRSLAWWQINPHLNHLWATTCPREPSWRPGEDRFSGPQRPPTGYAAIVDTVVPIYPRKWALPLCEPALRGEITTDDTLTWKGTRGLIVVRAAAISIGQPMRDEYSRKAIFDVAKYPDLRFTIDSLINVRPGDSLRADIVGSFEFRGVKKPVIAAARAWREAGGIRVTARFDMTPHDLVDTFGMSKLALGLGVGSEIWKYVHAGVDVVLKKADQG
jgi:hypothetical protein